MKNEGLEFEVYAPSFSRLFFLLDGAPNGVGFDRRVTDEDPLGATLFSLTGRRRSTTVNDDAARARAKRGWEYEAIQTCVHTK